MKITKSKLKQLIQEELSTMNTTNTEQVDLKESNMSESDLMQAATMIRSALELANHPQIKVYLEIALKLLEDAQDHGDAAGMHIRHMPGT